MHVGFIFISWLEILKEARARRVMATPSIFCSSLRVLSAVECATFSSRVDDHAPLTGGHVASVSVSQPAVASAGETSCAIVRCLAWPWRIVDVSIPTIYTQPICSPPTRNAFSEKDVDNPAVQLQGPFVVRKLTSPPAHRNVVMIAAGTGINPMVQQIRDYLAFSR